jgi:trigger factor
LEKRYAKTVEEDVIRALVPDYYDRAIRQAGIVPVLVEIPPLERVKVKRIHPSALPLQSKSSRRSN